MVKHVIKFVGLKALELALVLGIPALVGRLVWGTKFFVKWLELEWTVVTFWRCVGTGLLTVMCVAVAIGFVVFGVAGLVLLVQKNWEWSE